MADGHSWSRIQTMLYTSPRTISRWKKRFEQDGVELVQGADRGRPAVLVTWWVTVVIQWVLQKTPRDFGLFRSRWSCAALVLVLSEQHDVKVSAETMRRHLRRENLVWRRPRPVLGPKDPQYTQKLRRIRRLLTCLSEDETVVFQDEVDINTNPKIGSMWMRCGEQAEVETPGTNTKRYLAGSLHWRTGKLLVSEPATQRNAVLFVRHLHDLRRRLRHIGTFRWSATTLAFTTAMPSASFSPGGATELRSISFPSTPRRPTRSNVSGGIFTKRLLAIIAVNRSTSSSTWSSIGSNTKSISPSKRPFIPRRLPPELLSLFCGPI
jgi:transposase